VTAPAGWLATHFVDGSTRATAIYLLRAAGFLSGRASPEKLLDLVLGRDLERALQALRAAIAADPQGARAAAAQVLDEIARRASPAPVPSFARRQATGAGGGAPKPPSPRQLKFLADLGHPNPRAIRTSREAHQEIQRRLAQQPAGRR
jgi:hypothetical protein